MKTKTLFSALLLCLTIVIFNNCNKNGNGNALKENLLTAHTWEGTTVIYKVNGIDETATYAAMLQTISLTCLANHTYTLTSSAIGNISTGTWTLSGNTITATDETTGLPISITIVELTSSTLHITFQMPFTDPATQQLVILNVDATFAPAA